MLSRNIVWAIDVLEQIGCCKMIPMSRCQKSMLEGLAVNLPPTFSSSLHVCAAQLCALVTLALFSALSSVLTRGARCPVL